MKKAIFLLAIIVSNFQIKAQVNKIEPTGKVGIGTSNPEGSLHIASPAKQKSSSQRIGANLIIEGKSNSRTINKGASLGFAIPANSDGTNIWEQGRVFVTPDDNNNGKASASGRMYLQTRHLNEQGNDWVWRDNMVLRSSGYVGIGTPNPKGSFHIVSPAKAKSSSQKIGANLIIEGKSNTRTTKEGASLGFAIPASSDGINIWEQGRVLVTPDNNEGGASGRMYLQTRHLNKQGNDWVWRDNIVLRSSGNVGIGTPNPEGSLHISSPAKEKNSSQRIGAQLTIEGKSNSRTINKGASLGFAIPANSDGTNIWEQGRVFVTPDDNNNGKASASGRMYLQTRHLNEQGNDWVWRDNMVLRSSGYVGIGTPNPKGSFHIASPAKAKNSSQKIGANLIIEGKSNTRTTNEGASLGFAIPASSDGINIWEQGRVLVTPDNNEGGASGRMYLQTRHLNKQGNDWVWRDNIVLRSSGFVGIGTSEPKSELTVAGTVESRKVKVRVNAGADFVFNSNYKLKTLEETEKFIKKHNHLPEISSEREMIKNGLEIGEMNIKLLQKVEELTLYLIEQNKKINKLQKEIDTMSKSR